MGNNVKETKFTTSKISQLSGEEAFFGILYAAVTADCKVCKREIDNIWVIIEKMKLLPGETWEMVVDRLSSILQQEGHDALIALSVKCLPPGLRETAYSNAIDLLFTDGVVNYQEKIFMEKLRVLLGISQKFSDQVVEEMAFRYMNI